MFDIIGKSCVRIDNVNKVFLLFSLCAKNVNTLLVFQFSDTLRYHCNFGVIV